MPLFLQKEVLHDVVDGDPPEVSCTVCFSLQMAHLTLTDAEYVRGQCTDVTTPLTETNCPREGQEIK